MHERVSHKSKDISFKIDKTKLKRTLAAFAFVICPGDDIAVIAAQTFNTTTKPNMPDAAIIHEVPDVHAIFKVENLKKPV